jgi:hypothetical protein
MRLFIAILLAVVAWNVQSNAINTSSKQTTVLFDIHALGQTKLDQLKSSIEVGGWWLELGDQLLASADPFILKRLGKKYSVQRDLGLLSVADLALQARGCAVNPNGLLPKLADAGRFALVRQPHVFNPLLKTYSEEWREVKPNSVLEKEWANNERAIAKAIDPDAQRLADNINPVRWLADVTTLATFDRSTFSPGLVSSRLWIEQQMAAMGLQVSAPSYNFTYGSQNYTSNNVIGLLPGVSAPGEWVIVGAHYDSRNTIDGPSGAANTPGAEDNASGCAGVLELARAMVKYRPARSVYFICYSGEEQNLFGSKAHAAALQASGDLSRVKLSLIMDMVGYSGDADLDVLLESSNSAINVAVMNSFAAAASQYAPTLRALTASPPWGSDHVPYIDRGVPCLLTIENDWDVYPHYHKSTDRPANITNALAMGGGILRMNAAALAAYTGGLDALLSDGME